MGRFLLSKPMFLDLFVQIRKRNRLGFEVEAAYFDALAPIAFKRVLCECLDRDMPSFRIVTD